MKMIGFHKEVWHLSEVLGIALKLNKTLDGRRQSHFCDCRRFLFLFL
jgi:hypothetical protein